MITKFDIDPSIDEKKRFIGNATNSGSSGAITFAQRHAFDDFYDKPETLFAIKF